MTAGAEPPDPPGEGSESGPATRRAPSASHGVPAREPLVFVDDPVAPVLAPGDRHHLERVLRVRAGDPITVADGRGRWRRCRFGPGLAADGPVVVAPRPPPAITVAVALTKGDRPELAVQKLTEVGVDEIVLFRAARSVARWDEAKAARNLERLRVVAREAAMQSRRAWLPTVDGLCELAELAARPGAVLAQWGGSPPDLGHPVVLVGPEGGWSDDELALGLPTVTLGDGVLRAETAAIAAGVLLVACRAGLVRPPHPDRKD